MISFPRRRLWLFGLLALAVHLTLFIAITNRPRLEPSEATLAGKFVKRRPLRQQALRRALALPQPRRALRRTMASTSAFARATVDQQARWAATEDVLNSRQVSAVLPRRSFTPGYGSPQAGGVHSTEMRVAVAAQDQIDLGLELLDIDALDTGRYRALVIRDPGNPRDLRGYVRLAAVGIGSAQRAAADRPDQERDELSLGIGSPTAPDWRRSADVRSLDELAAELTAQTGLSATVERNANLDGTGWQDSPFVMLTSVVDFVPSTKEVANLGEYLVAGGFAYVEIVGFRNHTATYRGQVSDLASLRGLVEASLAAQGLRRGVDWDIRPLPLDHPLFNCYYEIKSLPRPYWSVVFSFVANSYVPYRRNPEQFGWEELPLPHLEGVFVRGRLAGIYSQQNYRDLWARRAERAMADDGLLGLQTRNVLGNRSSGDQALRLGINIVVYALTQEGSLARQYVVR